MSKLFPTNAELQAMPTEEREKFWRAMEAVDEMVDERKHARSYTNSSEAEMIDKQVNGFN